METKQVVVRLACEFSFWFAFVGGFVVALLAWISRRR